MSRDDIAGIVATLGDLVKVIREAEPADKADLYGQLGLSLTYQPSGRLVEATLTPTKTMRKGFVSEVGLEPGNTGCFPNWGRYP